MSHLRRSPREAGKLGGNGGRVGGRVGPWLAGASRSSQNTCGRRVLAGRRPASATLPQDRCNHAVTHFTFTLYGLPRLRYSIVKYIQTKFMPLSFTCR